MSRTDKDMPRWVRSGRFEPYHACGIGSPYYAIRDDCNLPIEPPPLNHENYAGQYSRRSRILRNCHWIVCWTYDQPLRSVRVKVLRRKVWNKPHRGKVQRAIRQALQGNWDVEFPDGRTRHNLDWLLD